MKTIQRIETFDGETHPTPHDAKKHLEELLGALLIPLARKLVSTNGKYSAILDTLEKEIETMREIVRIKDDMALEQESDE